MLEGKGGEFTKPAGAFAPYGKITQDFEHEIAQI